MTIRSGGRPRDGRGPQARPYDPDAYATADLPEYVEPAARRRWRRRGGPGGGHGWAVSPVPALRARPRRASCCVVSSRPSGRLSTARSSAWAADNPAALELPFVHDIVREDIGTAMTEPAAERPGPGRVRRAAGRYRVHHRDPPRRARGSSRDSRAFVLLASDRGIDGKLQAGTFLLRKNMTPNDLVTALLDPPANPYVEIPLRTGLRLEQITAKLQTLPLQMDPKDFYDEVTKPPKALIDDYPWLKAVLKDHPGVTLEGFLWPASYKVLPDTTPDELVRLMLDNFIKNVGAERLAVPKERGLDFYGVLTLASIVEREAVLDDERAADRRRLPEPHRRPARDQEQDPQRRPDGHLRERHGRARQDRLRPVAEVRLLDAARRPDEGRRAPARAAGLPDLHQRRADPGPDRDADARLDRRRARARTPRTRYLYFVAIPDGGGKHAFAKDNAAFQKLLKKYGYTVTVRLAGPAGRLRGAARRRAARPLVATPTGRPGPLAWPGCAPGSPTPASTRTSASGPSTPAT